MIRYIIEGLLIVAVILGFVFEEKIALFERRILKNLKLRLSVGIDEDMEERLRTERFKKQQKIREAELLELGCNLHPEFKIVRSENATSRSIA